MPVCVMSLGGQPPVAGSCCNQSPHSRSSTAFCIACAVGGMDARRLLTDLVVSGLPVLLDRCFLSVESSASMGGLHTRKTFQFLRGCQCTLLAAWQCRC